MKIKMLNRLSFIAVLAFLSLAAALEVTAQVRVTKVTSPDMLAGKKGIVYTLPGTLIHVNLSVIKTQQYAGPLAEFARDYLGIDDVITKNSVSYAIGDAALWTATEPDPGQVYLIEKEEKSQGEIWISFGKSTPVLTLEKFDKTVSPKGFANWNEGLFVAPEPGMLFRKYTESPTREVIDTVIRKVSIDTLVLEEKIFRHSMVEFSDQEKALEAAGRIKQIEQDKYNLLVGYQETAYSRESLEFMYDKLEEQRLEYLKLFTGVSVAETLKFDYQVFPESGKEEQKYSFAGFSKSSGMIAPEGQNAITISLQSDAVDLKPDDPDKNQPATGLVYRLPLTVQAIVSFQDKELVSKRVEVLQLGSTLTLPPEFKRVEFDLQTGALKSVVIE
jgi:hypothetical protein